MRTGEREREASRQSSTKSAVQSGAVALRPPEYGIAFADRAPVQRLEAGGTSSNEGVHRAARAGTAGPGHRLPHFDAVQRAFGSYSLHQVQAHTGPQAMAAAKSIGAAAYTVGSQIVFASENPSLHEVAHEAAHAVQQQAGVQLFGGVGQAGDRYEQHAEAVARETMAGRSAEPLLRSFVGARSSSTQPAVQRIEGGKSQTESSHPVVAPGEGYIRAVAKSDASTFVDDHAWIIIEYVKKSDSTPVTVVTDLRKNGVKFTRDGNAVPYASSLMNSKKYIGTTYKITQAQAEAAIAKGEDVSAGYQFDEVKTENPETHVWSTNSVPREDNRYIYNVTGKATFGITNRINCARYAAKLLKAAGVGSGWFEIRPRGGWFFKTPGQVAGGLFGQTKN